MELCSICVVGASMKPEGTGTNRNLVFLVVGALIAVLAILSYRAYEARRQPEGVQINIGPGGISVEKK